MYKNTLGDIVAIRDGSGNIVATYEYDAWGNITYQSGSIAEINPFRYRGYYYDNETGFYYLQTRYYDPEICRFINADDYELVATLAEVPGQLNLYAYCNNNPIMYVDHEGNFILSTLLIGAIVGFGVQFVSSAISQRVYDGEVNWTSALIDGVFGAAAGMVGATGLGAIASGLINSGLSLANGFIITGIENGWEFSIPEIIGIVGSSALAGITSGIAKYGAIDKIKEVNSFTEKYVEEFQADIIIKEAMWQNLLQVHQETQIKKFYQFILAKVFILVILDLLLRLWETDYMAF